MPDDHGEIDKISDLRVDVGDRGGTFWCRLPNGLKLRQQGYENTFADLDHWQLIVPDYLQEVSSR